MAENNPPNAVYQRADLEVFLHYESVRVTSVIWIAYKDFISAGHQLRLHFRGGKIEEVLVNNIPAKYERKDPLKNLAFIPKKKVQSGADIDLLYRAALEVSELGEMLITVPDLEKQKLDLPRRLPPDAPRDCIMTYERLCALHRRMTSMNQYEKNASQYDVEEEEEEVGKVETKTCLLQIKIKYILEKDTCNLKFRKPPSFIPLFEKSNGVTPTQHSSSTTSSTQAASPTMCVYTTSNTTGELRDVDGVRCWLPCLDYLDQRLVFDLSFFLSKPYFVASVGKRLNVIKAPNSSGQMTKRIYRFFTPSRIPACQVGFFIGRAETYSQDLDNKIKARIAVATGLNDFISSSPTPASAQDKLPIEGQRKRSNSITQGPKKDKMVPTFSSPPLPIRRLYSDKVQHTMLGFDMSLRLIHTYCGHKNEYDEITIIFVHNLNKAFVSFDNFFLIDAKFLHSNELIYIENITHIKLVEAYLYSWLVSSLPLSSYEGEFIVIGFIQYLLKFYIEEVKGEEESQYYFQKMYHTLIMMEKQGRSYPIANGLSPARYENFTLPYGVYLQAKCAMLFAMLDNKIGGGDQMRLVLRQLIKSPLLFEEKKKKRINEEEEDGEKLKRKRSNSISSMGSPFSVSSPNSMASPTIPSGSFSSNPYIRHSPSHNSPSVSPYHSPIGPGGYQSPYAYHPGSISPSVNYSVALYNNAYNRSPYAQGGYQGSQWQLYNPTGTYNSSPTFNSSPYSISKSDGGDTPLTAGDQSPNPSFSPSSLALSSTWASPTNISSYKYNNYGWGPDYSLLSVECLTAEAFILFIRHNSEASADLDEEFLNRYIYQGGIGLFRFVINVTPRVEGKARTIIITSDQVVYKNNYLLPRDQALINQELPMVMVEERDNNVTKPFLQFNRKKEIYKQQAYTRPGRRGGRPRREGVQIGLPSSNALDIRPARVIAKELEFPVKYVLFDPSFDCLAEVQNNSCDALLIEQLNSEYEELGGDYDRYRIFYQCQALRSLARSEFSRTFEEDSAAASAASATSGSTEGGIANQLISAKIPEKHDRLQVKAFYDCILGHTSPSPSSSTLTANPPPGIPLSVYTRAEAAFSLADWQNSNAPSFVNEAPTPNKWLGLEALLECFFILYMDKERQTLSPINLLDEVDTYLRNALLLAISSVQSQHGYTPWEVIETLLLVAEKLEDLSLPQEDENLNDFPFKIDYSHYKAVVLLALSNIRFSHIDCNNPNHPIFKIISLSKNLINDSFTQARALSRMNFKENDANFLPSLPSSGIHVAAAITCLGSMDSQTAIALGNNKAKGHTQMKALDKNTLHKISIISKIDYTKFFLPPDIVLKSVELDEDESKKSESNNHIIDEFDFFLCSPLVRAAAYEAFVHYAFAMHIGHCERAKRKQDLLNLKQQAAAAASSSTTSTPAPPVSTPPLPDPLFITATIETFQNISKYETSDWFKNQLAQILYDSLLDSPFRIVCEGLAHGSWLNSIGFDDILGFTLRPRPSSVKIVKIENKKNQSNRIRKTISSDYQRYAFTGLEEFIKVSIIIVNGLIMKSSFNQTMRATLLELWLYIFGSSVPPALLPKNNVYTNVLSKLYTKNDFLVNHCHSSTHAANKSDDDENYPNASKLEIRNPNELFYIYEEALKYGQESIVSFASKRRQEVKASKQNFTQSTSLSISFRK